MMDMSMVGNIKPTADAVIKSKIKWNVVDEETFKTKMTTVFEMVSDSLSRTLGPYGSTTIIEKFGEMHITKDGWQVLKNIHFDDNLYNNMLMLISRISAQVVIRVGDGSTSSIVAANMILREFENNKEFINSMRPKDFITLLTKCVNRIVDEIYANAKTIDIETFDDIYELAYISTNGDKNIASMIQNIYRETNNPSIEYLKSKTSETSYEIINGYQSNITYIDDIFCNQDDGTCSIANPMILMFDHKLDLDISLPIIGHAVQKATDEDRRLVVIAPHYDQHLLKYIGKNANIEFRARGTSSIVYTRISLINNVSHEMYNDFAVLTGSTIINERSTDDITEENISEYLGGVESMIIRGNNTLIQGFYLANDQMFEKIRDNAKHKYEKMLEDNKDHDIVDIALNDVKQRYTKLRCLMGVIRVGGVSTLEKNAMFDLVEDAVKACESAYNHGYNCGGSLMIPRVIADILSELPTDPTALSQDTLNERNIYTLLSDAFAEVFKTIIRNKYSSVDSDQPDVIYEKCMNDPECVDMCYDLITDTYTNKIINSCETDIEILKAAASIISLLVSSNQYISILNDTEL